VDLINFIEFIGIIIVGEVLGKKQVTFINFLNFIKTIIIIER
jgi:hypothetical protein